MSRAELRFPIVLSIAAALLTIGLKWGAYYLTGSVGLLSDATESLINLVAAATAFISLWYAARPADPSHTYGHEKIEFFSSGLEGALILVAAAGIAAYAVERLVRPIRLESLEWGVIAVTLATVVNFFVARLLLRVARRTGSIVLEADGRHLMTDVWTSSIVVVALGLVRLTDRPWIDPVLGLLVAAHICWTGFDLVRRSFNGLMDHALPLGEQDAVRAAVESQLGPGMDYHALRTRQAGARRFVDFHLLVPGTMTVYRAHELTARVEAAVRAALPGIEITVHVEPIEDRAAWEDSELLEVERAAREAARRRQA